MENSKILRFFPGPSSKTTIFFVGTPLEIYLHRVVLKVGKLFRVKYHLVVYSIISKQACLARNIREIGRV